MAEKKQSFRIRFGWRNRSSQVQPEPRPTAKTQNPPAQTTSAASAERPPFRPAGKAPVKASPSPTLSPSPPRGSESQKTTSATAQTQIEVELSPPSPSPGSESPKTSGATTQTQIEVGSSPPSPSRGSESQKTSGATTQTQIEDVGSSPPSPSRGSESQKISGATTQTQTEVDSSPPSPSHVASQPQTQTQSEPTTTSQESSQSPSSSAEPSSLASQIEPKEAMSQSPQRDPQPTISDAEKVSAEAVETVALTEKVDPDANGGDHEDHSEPETATKEHKEDEKVVQALTKEEQINDPGSEKHAKEETVERKEALATTSSSLKPIRTSKNRTSRMSVQKMVPSAGEQAPPPHEEISKDVLKLDNLVTGDELLDKEVNVITLSGENRGASMQLSSEPAKEELSIPIHRSYKSNPDDSLEATTDGEASDGENLEGQTSSEDEQKKAFINSNVQCINNSIVFNSSLTERDPGVQSIFSQNTADSSNSIRKPEPIGTHKAQSTKTPSEKLTYEPTVRRRCLRGLLMEPSDSDPDDPEKPRRHGCRYSCGHKNKDNGKEIETL